VDAKSYEYKVRVQMPLGIVILDGLGIAMVGLSFKIQILGRE